MEGARLITWMGQRFGYGLIPDRGPDCGRRQSLGMAAPGYVHIVDGKLTLREEARLLLDRS